MSEENLEGLSLEEIKSKYLSLKSSHEDMKNLHETVSSYSAEMEESLFKKNEEVNSYMERMKKYLSSQLYDLIVSGGSDDEVKLKRQRVTIFFSDIVGFSTMTDAVEPEALSECLNYYLSEMSQIVKKFGGTLDKFIGDAIMVFFGAPKYENDEKHANDCVKMAIEMIQKLPEINTYWKKKGISEGVNIRIGINTGYATVGNFGSDQRIDYTIIGNEVNVAARLEGSAKPGKILISETTRNLVADDEKITLVYKGSIHVKGIHKPIKVYEPTTSVEELENEDIFNVDNFLSIHEGNISLANFSLEYGDEVEDVKDKLKHFKKMLKDASAKVTKELKSRI